MLPPIPIQDILEARPERVVLPPLDAPAIDVRRVGVPLVPWVSHAESISVAEWSREVDVGEVLLRLDMVKLI